MKLLLALLALAALALPVHAADTVTVRLEVNLVSPQAPAKDDCSVTVAAGSNVGAVLDAAQAQGCIRSWSSDSYPGYGRYVTCIDGVCQQAATYWSFWIDAQYAQTGIDGTPVQQGALYQFVYNQWVVDPITLPATLP